MLGTDLPQLVIERLIAHTFYKFAAILWIMFVRNFWIGLNKFAADELQPHSLKPSNNVSDDTALDCVRLDNDKCSFHKISFFTFCTL